MLPASSLPSLNDSARLRRETSACSSARLQRELSRTLTVPELAEGQPNGGDSRATAWRAEVWRPFTLHRRHVTPVDVRAPKDDALAEWDEIVVIEEPTQIAAALHTEGVARVRAVSTWGAVSEWTIFGALKAQRLAYAAAPALDKEIACCRRFKVGACCVNVPQGVEWQPSADALPTAPPFWYAVVTERLGRKVLDKLEWADLGPAEIAVADDAMLIELLAC